MEERTFRPVTLVEFVGQGEIKKTLAVMLDAAKRRKQPLEHICFYGGPGLGKTTLAGIISTEMGGGLKELAAPAIERLGDLVSILASLHEGDVLFLDEIHRLKPEIAETLYSAMEDFKVSVPVRDGSGNNAAAVTIALQSFTLVGGTTDFGLLSAPFRARFGHLFPLDIYTEAELYQVVQRAASKSGALLDDASAKIIAARSRGTPRIALRLFRRCVDLATTKDDDVTEAITTECMAMLAVDALGLDQADRKYLQILAGPYNGGPVGPKSLAASCGLDEATVIDVVEPWLLRIGLISRTRQGRKLLRKGWEHVKTFSDIEPSSSSEINSADLEVESTTIE